MTFSLIDKYLYPTFYPSIRNATFDGTLCTERKPRPKKNKVEWHQLRQKASTLLLSISFIRISKKEFIFTKVLSKPHLTNEFRSGLIFQVQDVLYLQNRYNIFLKYKCTRTRSTKAKKKDYLKHQRQTGWIKCHKH